MVRRRSYDRYSSTGTYASIARLSGLISKKRTASPTGSLVTRATRFAVFRLIKSAQSGHTGGNRLQLRLFSLSYQVLEHYSCKQFPGTFNFGVEQLSAATPELDVQATVFARQLNCSAGKNFRQGHHKIRIDGGMQVSSLLSKCRPHTRHL